MKVLTSEELKDRWDIFSKEYENYSQSFTYPIVLLLLSSLGFTSEYGKLKSSNIKSCLEIACGPGAGTELVLQQKKESTSFTTTDISTEMIKLTKKRFGMSQDQEEITSKKFKIVQCDAEKLPFEDGSFDRYLSNLCLHLVNSPETMLKESYRVLEKGGVAAFSVWGRKEHSHLFTIQRKCAEDIGIDMGVVSRTPFHLSDVTKLREMALNAGFSRVLANYSFFTSSIASGEEYVQISLANPEFRGMAERIGEEKFNTLKSNIVKHVDQLLNSGQFIGLEVAFIVCTK